MDHQLSHLYRLGIQFYLDIAISKMKVKIKKIVKNKFES